MISNLKSILIYLFSAITAIVLLFIIYQISLDFSDPLHMEMTNQLMNLSYKQITILDKVELFIYSAFLIILSICVVKGNKKLLLIVSISIWVLMIIDGAIIEPLFENTYI
jgi:hypothetical protein